MGIGTNLTEAYSVVRRTITGTVRAGGGGEVGGFLVCTGTPTLTLYDGIDNTGTLLLNGLVCVAGTPYPFPVHLNNGLYAVLSGVGDISFFIN